MKLLLPPLCAVAIAMPVFAANPVVRALPDFDLRLLKSAQTLDAPVWADWDAQGRMWLACTPRDPLKRRPAPGGDSILILTDSNQDGVLEHHIFADGLKSVGSFVFHRNGVILAHGSDIVLVNDTDGDGIADHRHRLFGGFAGPPAAISSFRHALDGWIYAVYAHTADSQVIFARSSVGKSRTISPGVFRFKPDGSAIETVSAFSNTTASIVFSWDGELFFSRAGGPHVSHVGLPEPHITPGAFKDAYSFRKIEDHQLLFPSVKPRARSTPEPGVPFKLASGVAIYDGGAWPERYQGNYYVCDPSQHLIHEDVISRPESAYFEATRRLDGEFLVSSDETFRPAALRVGPDGAMHVLDSSSRPRAGFPESRASAVFAAPAPVDGRIWRLQHKQARRFNMPSFATASNGDLARALEHQNAWVRHTAMRLIVERDDQTSVPGLQDIVKSSRFPHSRVAALWALHHLGALSHNVWTNALEDPHSAVQKNAWLVFAESSLPVTPEVEKLLNRLYKDADERVRLAGLRAIAKGPLTPAGRESVAKLFPDLKDVWSKSVVLSIARGAPLDFLQVAFTSDKSENFRELVVPLVEQLARDNRVSPVLNLTAKHAAKAEKLTAAVHEALARLNRN